MRTPDPSRESPIERGIGRLLELRTTTDSAAGQADHWEGEVVWNPMLAAQYVIALHAMGRTLPESRKRGLVMQLEAMQIHDGDGQGCWGMHIYGDASLFVTTLCYVAARLCGVDSSDALLAPARAFFRQEDVLAIPSWGKLWLSIAGLYEWSGVNAVPPETWLLPKRAPVHPSNYYCHTRLIYMGMACVRALQVRAPETPLVRAIRTEIYPGRAFRDLDFRSSRGRLRKADLWAPPSRPLRVAYQAANFAEPFFPGRLREVLIDGFIDRIRFDLRSTDYTCLSPVNGLLFALTLNAKDPDDPDLHKQLARFAGSASEPPQTATVQGWAWEDDKEGFRVTGARSATWDTAFALQALSDARKVSGASPELDEALVNGLAWLETQQIVTPSGGDVDDYREQDRVDPTGGFCFAGIWHGWPVSDCTAEALLAFLEAPSDLYRVEQKRVEAGVRFLLQAQNFDGGFGSYEARKQRAGLEWMNPAEMFGDSMTELSYYECTASNIAALCAARDRFPTMLRDKVDGAIRRAEVYLRASQNEDGSWNGSWGVAYLYGTLFGVRGLRAAGAGRTDPAITRACEYVKAHQRADGAFSESWRSCLEDRYVEGSEPHPAQTAWALLTLVEGDAELCNEAIQRAADALEHLQDETGDWPSPMMSGVFFRTALLDYRLYRRFFPLWALALSQSEVQSARKPVPVHASPA